MPCSHQRLAQDTALWPMDEERPVSIPSCSKADVSAWLAGERAQVVQPSGDDDVEGLSPRSSLGAGGRAGSLPFLQCLTAPAMHFDGAGEEPQGGSPMQVSSAVAAGADSGRSASDAVNSKGKETKDGGACSNCSLIREGRNGLHASSSHAEMHSSASSIIQQQTDTRDQQSDDVRLTQPAAARQEAAPQATAYREQPPSHLVEQAMDAGRHGSRKLPERDAEARKPDASSQDHVAAGSGAAVPAAVTLPRDAPEQPPSTGTSPQHDRKRSRLRMNAACSSRRANGAAKGGMPASAGMAANGAMPNGGTATAQQPVRRSFELRLVPSTPDVSASVNCCNGAKLTAMAPACTGAEALYFLQSGSISG